MKNEVRTARGSTTPEVVEVTTCSTDRSPETPMAAPMLNEHPLTPPPPGYRWSQSVISGAIDGQRYRTILQVITPIDPSHATGIVMLEPWHRAGYWTAYSKVQSYLTREGHSAAIVVSNRDVLETFIRPQDPDRYHDLSLPEGEYVDSEVMAHAGALLRSGAIEGVAARHCILAGQSTEAYWVRRYIAQEHHLATVSDQHIFSGYFPAQSALSSPRSTIDDIDVPVIELQGESELIRSFARGGERADYRRPDGALYRLYEVPGMPHVCTRNGASIGRSSTMQCVSPHWSNFPLFPVHHLGLDNLISWIEEGTPAPEVPRIMTREEGRIIERDAFGNALGGLRTSYFEVPLATVHATNGETPENLRGERCDFFAWDEALPAAQLRALYGSHSGYVARLDEVLDELVAKRWYLLDDAQEMREEATQQAHRFYGCASSSSDRSLS